MSHPGCFEDCDHCGLYCPMCGGKCPYGEDEPSTMKRCPQCGRKLPQEDMETRSESEGRDASESGKPFLYEVREPGCTAWESDIVGLRWAIMARQEARQAGLSRAMIIRVRDGEREEVSEEDIESILTGNRERNEP